MPGDDYFEIECAKQHGGWPAWSLLPVMTRGRLMAHEMEKNMRDHYSFDKRSKGDKSTKAPDRDIASLIRDRWQGRPGNVADK